MPTFDSTQYATYTSNAGKVSPGDHGGRVRVAFFDIPATTGLAQNDFVNLVTLPKDAKIVGGRVDFGAYGASVTLDIGYSGAENRYLSAADVSSAGQSDFADTVARNLGDTLTAEKVIQAKFEGANPSDTAVSKGYILYVLD